MLVNLVSSIVLARLLTPSDFGTIGMLMIFISLANSLVDGGFGSALIQKKDPTNEDYSTIFYLNVFLSVALYALLLLSSNAISKFYGLPDLRSILNVLGIVLILNALSVVQQNQLRKRLNFKRLAVVNLTSSIVSLFGSVILAYKGAGVWSLVFQQISFSSCNAILFWVFNKWYPQRIFSIKSFKELFGFGSYILFSNLLSTVSNEIQGLLVAKRFSSQIMGLYTQAFRLEAAASTSISSIISQVSYPLLSSLQFEEQRFLNAVRNISKVTIFISAAVLGFMIIDAEPLIIFIFSDKWIDSIPYFQILCVAGVAVCLQSIGQDSLAALGKSRVVFRWTIIKRVLTIVLCIMGIIVNGMYGLLWGIVLGAWSVHAINMYLMDKHIGYDISHQLKDLFPSISLSLLIGIPMYFIGENNILDSPLLTLSINFLLYFGAYFVLAKGMGFEAVQLTSDMFKTAFSFLKPRTDVTIK